MNEKTKKSDINYLAMVAAMAKQCIDKDGVCGVGVYLDHRKPGSWYVPGVQMLAKTFLEYFGDEGFEYRTRGDGYELVKEIHGVTFYALIDDSDMIREGRLV